jgi:hypothetical protein
VTAEEIARALSAAAKLSAPALPGAGKTVAEWASVALGLAADLATLGHDPVATITRVRDLLPDLERNELDWASDFAKRFGG